MFKLIRDIVRGAGYLEGYGYHPGTNVLLIFIGLGAVGGFKGGNWQGALGGAAIMALVMVPIWMAGCASRARDYDRDVKRTFDILSKPY